MYLIQAIIVFLLFTFGSLPALFTIFKKTPDKGFALSPILSMLAISYSAWLLSSLKFASFSTNNLILITVVYFGLNLIVFLKIRDELICEYKKNKIIFIEIIVFIFLFILFIIIRLWNPDLWHPIMGGEKPMDFAFLNSIINTKFFPPRDPWFSGETINYYYFGQVIVATLSKIAHVPTNYFYNFVIPFLYAISGLIAFSTTYQLCKSKIAGFITVFLLLIAGNWAQIKVIFDYFLGEPTYINSWYWTATRVMPNNEINEFPFFTFLYADLHAHLISIPLIISVLYLILSTKNTPHSQILKQSLLIGFLSGVILMTNIWDYPTVLLAIFIFNSWKIFKYKSNFIKKLGSVLFLNTTILITSYLTALPFLFNFKSGAFGLSLYKGVNTDLLDFILINGSFLLLILFYLFIRIYYWRKKIILYLITVVILVSFILFKLYFLPVLIIIFALFIKILISHRRQLSTGGELSILLIALSMFLFMVPDFIDFKLGLGRMNTVFKFYFQAWIFLSISAGWMITEIWGALERKKSVKIIFLLVLFFVSVATISYPLTATFAKINDRFEKRVKLTFDGEDFMKSAVYRNGNNVITLSGDYLSIEWIKNNIETDAVIAEAQTPIYGWGSRISVYTGRQTILGWDWHEIAHRSYLDPTIIRLRSSDVETLYTTTDQLVIKNILEKYSVDYIYYGELERKHYQLSKKLVFDSSTFLKKIYENNTTSIYKYLR